jgi:glycosyltransferase involved in cell wall biosynthesis
VGIQMAVGEYVTFLDADDLLLPNKLQVQVSYLDRHPGIDVVYSNGYCFWKAYDGTQTCRSFIQQGLLNSQLGGPEDSLPLLAIQNAFPIHAALARRKAIVEVVGFDENLFGREDWDLWLRVAENHSFAYLDEIVALYRQGNAGVTAQSERQARAVQVIGSKVECSDWFKRVPSQVRSRFYLSRGVQELEYSQTQAAKRYFRQALKSDPMNYPAWAAFLAACVFGRRAVELYHIKRRLQGTQISRLDAVA